MTTAPTPTYDVTVIGGGLAGLAAAISAATTTPSGIATGPAPKVLLIDGHRLGGRARCDDRAGYVFNRGPRALYTGGPAEAFLAAHGVRLAGGPPPVPGGAALDRGALHRFPATPLAAARTTLFTVREKVAIGRAFAALPRLDPSEWVGHTLAELTAHLRLTEVPARFLLALSRLATYANAPEVLDAGAALAQIQAATSTGVRYLDGGWQPLVDAMAERAASLGVTVRVGDAARLIGPSDAHGTRLVTVAADEISTRSVVIAAGGPDAASALLDARPSSWDRCGPPATAACLELGVRQQPRTRFVLGVDEPLYLSVHCPPARLAPEGHAVVHLMRYQAPDDHLDATEQHTLLSGLAHRAGIGTNDIVEERFLARMTVSHGMPTATNGGMAGRPDVAVPGHAGVYIAGDWVGPTGMLADAAVASGAAAGKHAMSASTTMTVT